MAKQNIVPIDSGVYVITNNVNGMIYVGSSRSVSRRFRHHKRALKLGIHPSRQMIEDFNRFGSAAFSCELVQVVSPGEDLMTGEQRWIDKLRPFDPAIGYNLFHDARGANGYKRSLETRGKMQQSALNRPPEHNERIASSLTGRYVALETGLAISSGRKASPKAKAAILETNAAKRKLSDDDVRRIRKLHEGGAMPRAISAEYGVSRRVIRAILGGETYQHVE